jgi:hypothetical protein
MTNDWTDSLAGARMQVDQQFEHRVEASEFTSQEWGLIMTAVEFDIHEPGDPERAELYADTENLPEIVPELERIQREMGGSPTAVEEGHGSGITGRIRQMVDSLTADRDTSGDSERLAKAETLVQDYAEDLQTYLEKRGRWDELRQAASEERDGSEATESGETESDRE